MLQKRLWSLSFQLFPLFLGLLLLLYYFEYRSKQEVVSKYRDTQIQMQKEAKAIIIEKQKHLKLISTALAGDRYIKESLIHRRNAVEYLRKLSSEYEHLPDYKYVWFHVVDNRGISFYRTWDNRSGDNVAKFRPDIRAMIKKPVPKDLISVGKYDMTYKSQVPIYDDNGSFLGVFETIAKFNSVVLNLREVGMEAMIVADKKYKKQIKKPFSKRFIDDYYLVNINTNETLLKFVEAKGIEKIINIEGYKIFDTESLYVTIYRQKDIHGENQGYFILSKPLNDIDLSAIKSDRNLAMAILVFIFIVVSIFLTYSSVIREKYARESMLKLENMVHERTQMLEQSNRELSKSEETVRKSYAKLKEMQKQLVEHEKMASLGGLVAGVSHEINTPVGSALTGITYLLGELDALLKKYSAQEMSEEDFTDFIALSQQLGHSIEINLEHAVDLVRSFKQVAVDQSSEEIREFFLKEYVDEILQSIHSQIKQTPHRIELHIDEALSITSYPGAFSQMFTNMILNSFIHGFDDTRDNVIDITIAQEDEDLKIVYKDNGKGMSKEHLEKVFEPFFTTNRFKGGSGLGMHIVYNIVTQKLEGNITCKSAPQEGVEFTIIVPLKAIV